MHDAERKGSRDQDKQPPEASGIERPWAMPAARVVDAMSVAVPRGLSHEEVAKRRRHYGENRVRGTESRSALQILVEQVKSVIVGLLAIAAVLALVFGNLIEGVTVVAVIVVNTLIGFVTELRAVRSMEALQELSQVTATVRREGHAQSLPARDIVPGDILVVSGGDVITADARLVEASKLQVDESALTGESVPVAKQSAPVEAEAPLAERASMLYKGTAVTRGAGEAVVVATGMATELGQISSLVAEAEEQATPLEERLQALGRTLIGVTLGIAVVVAAAGILAGRPIKVMIETAIALAVASVPEGLPIVATVALARGMARMAKRNALINRLAAVETLGATTVILTDKTGTLTENRMTVTHLSLDGKEIDVSGRGLEMEGRFTAEDGAGVEVDTDARLRRALEIGVLCNDADLAGALESPNGDGGVVGDPLEVALLAAGAKAGLRRDALLQRQPEIREVAFEADTKMMATYHAPSTEDGPYRVAVKGALEPVMTASTRILGPEDSRPLDDGDRDSWAQRSERLAADGLRVIALAEKQVATEDAAPYEDLTFVGLVGLLDPPRTAVQPSLEACQAADIRVVMVTGDQPATARHVALAVGLTDDEQIQVVRGQDLDDPEEMDAAAREAAVQTSIFARVSPKQKLDLIALHQDAGAIVAMTGDGVNDAPALKKADIGVAMGERGTQVAREAADMILKDDAFASIVTAVQQGRAIFENIRNFVLYLLSCNVAEILVVGAASVANAPLPIRPLQILFLNLVTDVFPALALGVGEGDPHLMERPPRDPAEPVIGTRQWIAIGGYSVLITVAVLGVLAAGLIWRGLPQERAVTLSFLALAFAQLWHVFNMRRADASLWRNDITQNRWVWGAILLCIGLLLLAVYLPFLASLLSLVPPRIEEWGIVLAGSLSPLLVGQVAKQIMRLTTDERLQTGVSLQTKKHPETLVQTRNEIRSEENDVVP